MGSYKQWFQDRQQEHTATLASAHASLTQAQSDLDAATAAIDGHNASVKSANDVLAAAQAKLDAANQALTMMTEPALTEDQIDQLYQLQQQAS